MLKNIEKELLSILYLNRGKSMTTGHIRRELKEPLKTSEIEVYLRNLKESKMIRFIRVPSSGSGQFKVQSFDKYEITGPGEQTVESDFDVSVRPEKQNSSTYIFGETIVFGNILNIEINIQQIINELNDDLKEEIKEYVTDLQNELNKDLVNKSNVRDIIKKITSKGISKLTDAALSYLIKHLLG